MIPSLSPAAPLRQAAAVLLLAASVSSARLVAQAPVRPERPAPATWQVGTYLGVARSSPGNGALGTMPNRDHLLLGLQAGTTILRVGAVQVNYVAQLLPLLVVHDRTAAAYDSLVKELAVAPLPRRAWAVGIAPFGLELATPASRRVSAYLSSAGGALIFSRAYPDVTGRRTNFTLEAGGGIRLRTRASQWAQLGYKYHHLSNAGTAFANPGLDANLFYAGYQWTARLPR